MTTRDNSHAAPTRDWIKRQGEDAGKATFPELFFDLVFVFALIQLSHTLSEDFGSTAVVEAGIIILALWWIWIDMTWLTTLLNTDKEPVRLFLFLMMFCGVLLAIALPKAFAHHGLIFACIYSTMQIGRSLFSLYAFRGVDHEAFLTFVRITLWLLVSCVFWVTGGLLDIEGRLIAWSIAIAIEYAAPAFLYYVPGMNAAKEKTLNISGEHLAERCALFIIICLGETILTTGRTAGEHMNSSLTFAVFCGAFASTIVMWWIYFHHGQEKTSEKAENADEPEKVAQNLFNYGHLPIVGGIILTAVGEDFSLSHATEPATLRYSMAILGGPLLFLAGNIGVKIAVSRVLPVSHFAGLVLLAAAFLIPGMPVYGLQIMATAILFGVALWEYVSLNRISQKTA